MQIIAGVRLLKAHWYTLNLFDSPECRIDAMKLRIAITSTRIYLLLLITMFINLVVYGFLVSLTRTVSVQTPSERTYTELHEKHPTSLSCPCKNMAIQYSDFMKISIDYHPVCSSGFITDSWINQLFIPNMAIFHMKDFRTLAMNYFQLLSTYCSISERAVRRATDDFLSKTLLDKYLISETLLKTQIYEEVLFALSSAANMVRQNDEYIRKTFHGNQLQTAYQTPKTIIYRGLFVGSATGGGLHVLATMIQPDESTTCNCLYSASCSKKAAYAFADEDVYPVGFLAACYANEGLLQSTLECLFNLSCTQFMFSIFPNISIPDVDVLRTNDTQFLANTTMETLVYELFINHQSTIVSFATYYEKCAPVSCTYTFSEAGGVIFVVTTIIGLLGGFVIVLRFCVFNLVTQCYHILCAPREPREVSLRNRLRTMWSRMKCMASELNLFDTRETSTDPFEQATGRIMTRTYIVFLCLSMAIIIFYTAINLRIESHAVQDPSETVFRTLYDRYPSTLHCPCSKITIPYGSFVSLAPTFHPVCTSWLVSDEWIQYVTDMKNVRSDYFEDDFRSYAPSFFSVLVTLCNLAETTVDNAWEVVSRSVLVTDEALSNEYLITRANTSIAQFQTNTVDEFKRGFAIINMHTQDMLIPEGGNIRFLIDSQHTDDGMPLVFLGTRPRTKSSCTCGFDDSCADQLVFYRYFLFEYPLAVYSVPGFYAGCSPMNSVRMSTVECFADQSCMDIIVELLSENIVLPNSTTILALTKSRFSANTVMGNVIDDLMVDQWNITINFSKYYRQCKPRQCTYTYTTRGDPLYVFSTTVGVFGGLTVILRLLTLILVRFVRNRKRSSLKSTDSEVQVKFIDRAHRLVMWLKERIQQLNLFESKLSWNDHDLRRTEIITTRFYLLALAACITIAVTYTASLFQLRVFTVKTPSKEMFAQLYSDPKYGTTLECPCRSLTIPYKQFVRISPHFHQICSSDFVISNFRWNQLFQSFITDANYPYDDFRAFIVPQFRALAAVCAIAQKAVADALISFLSNALLSNRAESTNTIRSRMSSVIERFQWSTTEAFLIMFTSVKEIAKGNRIVSATLSNWYPETIYLLNFDLDLDFLPRTYKNESCSCDSHPTCSSPAAIDDWSAPGFRVGCYPIESLLQSTLECLYDATCINTIKPNDSLSDIIFRPLDPLLSSPNATVYSLVNGLMIDQWETSVMYDQYYASCAPPKCTYSVDSRFDSIYVFTTVLGLTGGLTVVLKLIIPILVKLGRQIVKYCRGTQVQPVTHSVAEVA